MGAVRYYFDEHIPHSVAHGLRQLGVDVVVSQEAGMTSADDEVHLQFATQDGRVVYTHDRDFTRLHATGVSHGGIVYSSQGLPVRVMIDGLFEIFQVLTAEEMQDQLRYL
jgi:uncharacterized protein with PIN domain